jgi:predicted ABC-type ATPase
VARRKTTPRRRGTPSKGEKRIVIIAGPNGAGKTTLAEEFLVREAGCPQFINADLIAQGLSPFAPEKAALRAGRVMLQQMAMMVKAGESFAFETTLSGRNYARHIVRWRAAGYRVKVIFLSLPTPDVALSRVRMRVQQCGHSIPDEVVVRRFSAGLNNFRQVYSSIVDTWTLFDCSGPLPLLLEAGDNP